MYQIEQQIVEQETELKNIRRYVENQAVDQPMHEVEENLFRMLLRLGLSLLKEAIAQHGTGKVEGKLTDSQGQVLAYHSLKPRKYLSIFGEAEIERAYYRAETGPGVFPLDAKLNLPERKYSYLLAKWSQDRIAEEPYDEATGGLSDLLGISLWKQGQEELACEVTGEVEQFYREKGVPEAEGQILCATADCKGVAMVPRERSIPAGEGKSKVRRSKGDKKKGLRRDAVVTADFTFNPESRTPVEMIHTLMKVSSRAAKQEETEARSPINKQVFAGMFGKEEAFRQLADRIEARDPLGTKPIYVQIDGDPALEKGILSEFARRGWTDRIEGVCLDIMHGMEYLWDAGTSLYGEKNPKREQWVRKKGLDLLDGQVGRVIGGIRQSLEKRDLSPSKTACLEKAVTYFDNHRHLMHYDEFLKAGYPIATGVVEGACGSLVKDRTDRSGMRWTRKGAQAVLNLRALKRNDHWDEYWGYHIEHERERLYAAVN